MIISLRMIFGSKPTRTRIKDLEARNQFLLDQNGRLLDEMERLMAQLEINAACVVRVRGERTAVH